MMRKLHHKIEDDKMLGMTKREYEKEYQRMKSDEEKENEKKEGYVCGYCGYKKCRCKYENGMLKGE